MNLLKSFSQTTDIAPDKAFIYEKFFPLDFSDYVVFETQSTDPNLHYCFWFRVLELVEPLLSQKGIKIVHFIEDKRYPFPHVYVDKNSTMNEKAYLIKRAKLFCGMSKIYSLLASDYGVKQAYIKTDYSIDNLLVDEKDTIHTKEPRKNFLNPTGIKINNIRPEEIAEKILSTLFGAHPIFDRTISIGKAFATPTIELVPDCSFKIQNKSVNEILVRMDMHFSEENLIGQLKGEPASIVTNKSIKENLLVEYRDKVKKVYYKVEQNSDASFLKILDKLKINYEIITTLKDEDLNPEKIKYFDFKKINRINSLDLKFLDGLDASKIYFKAQKMVVKSGRTYPSKWHMKNNLPSNDIRVSNFALPPVIDDSFKEEADHFYFLTTEQI